MYPEWLTDYPKGSYRIVKLLWVGLSFGVITTNCCLILCQYLNVENGYGGMASPKYELDTIYKKAANGLKPDWVINFSWRKKSAPQTNGWLKTTCHTGLSGNQLTKHAKRENKYTTPTSRRLSLSLWKGFFFKKKNSIHCTQGFTDWFFWYGLPLHYGPEVKILRPKNRFKQIGIFLVLNQSL